MPTNKVCTVTFDAGGDASNNASTCVQINRLQYTIYDALAHCQNQGSTLALPKNEEDNFALSEAFGYHYNEVNTITGEEIHEHLNLWIGAYRDQQGKA